jgi:16S rRNA (cytidine1402-2'-O)-methyltransferase
LHEEFLRGSAAEVLEVLKSSSEIKGEITLLIGKAEETGLVTSHGGADALVRPTISQRIEQLMSEEKIDEKAALKKVAKERGISKSEAYRQLQREK